jgi:rhodanese-related sulfurtransferase
MNECSVEDLKSLVNEGWKIIDVREPDELVASSANLGEINIPLGTLESKLDSLDVNEKYILLCRSGGRSSNAYNIMNEAGFKNLKNARGGMIQYERYLSFLPED